MKQNYLANTSIYKDGIIKQLISGLFYVIFGLFFLTYILFISDALIAGLVFTQDELYALFSFLPVVSVSILFLLCIVFIKSASLSATKFIGKYQGEKYKQYLYIIMGLSFVFGIIICLVHIVVNNIFVISYPATDTYQFCLQTYSSIFSFTCLLMPSFLFSLSLLAMQGKIKECFLGIAAFIVIDIFLLCVFINVGAGVSSFNIARALAYVLCIPLFTLSALKTADKVKGSQEITFQQLKRSLKEFTKLFVRSFGKSFLTFIPFLLEGVFIILLLYNNLVTNLFPVFITTLIVFVVVESMSLSAAPTATIYTQDKNLTAIDRIKSLTSRNILRFSILMAVFLIFYTLQASLVFKINSFDTNTEYTVSIIILTLSLFFVAEITHYLNMFIVLKIKKTMYLLLILNIVSYLAFLILYSTPNISNIIASTLFLIFQIAIYVSCIYYYKTKIDNNFAAFIHANHYFSEMNANVKLKMVHFWNNSI